MATLSSRELKERSNRYSKVISALVLGSFFLISRLIGVKPDQGLVHAPTGVPDVSRVTGTPRWEDPSILSQVALGAGLLVLAVWWYHRLADPRLNVFRRRPPPVKHVGAGKSRGALNTNRNPVGGQLEPVMHPTSNACASSGSEQMRKYCAARKRGGQIGLDTPHEWVRPADSLRDYDHWI
jgi:hypothetical protein